MRITPRLDLNVPLLHNMSAPSKTAISFDAPAGRTYGHGVIIALPDGLSTPTPGEVLKLLGQDPPVKRPDLLLKRFIEARAKVLPLPPALAITNQVRSGDAECENLLTIVTILAKSSSRVYLRDKTPNLTSIAAGRRFVLVVPKGIRL